ncbi:MAG: cyanophycinase [Gemmatimonadota bacterium]
MRGRRVLLTAGLIAALQGGAGATRSIAAQQPRGVLLIVGGGHQPPDLVRHFVDLAGGSGTARIAVVPMASSEPVATGEEKAEELRGLGARVFVLNLTRAQAESDSAVRLLDGVTGVWFTGGDQVSITSALLGTAVHRAIAARYRDGAVLGGTSAGAAIMSDSMLTGNQYRAPPDTNGYYGDEYDSIARHFIEIVPGLGFLHGAIVDQHFITRERTNRLLSVILERPTLIGVGIDEGTALEVRPDGTWRVLGASAVMVFDARGVKVTRSGAPALGAADIRLHVLPAGSVYDPRRGQATLPE